jgi:hypothetical protein
MESISKSNEDFWLSDQGPQWRKKGETEEEVEEKYAAYLRKDAYGAMGRGDISMREKMLLLIALFTIVPLKVVLLLATVTPYYLLCRLLTMCHAHSSAARNVGNAKQSKCCNQYGVFDRSDDDHLNGVLRDGSRTGIESNESILSKNYINDGGFNAKHASLCRFRQWVVVIIGRFLSRVVLFILGFYKIKVFRHGGVSRTSEVYFNHKNRKPRRKLLKCGLPQPIIY